MKYERVPEAVCCVLTEVEARDRALGRVERERGMGMGWAGAIVQDESIVGTSSILGRSFGR